MFCAETCISRYFAWWAQLVVGSPTRRRDGVVCGLKEKVQISLLAVDLTCHGQWQIFSVRSQTPSSGKGSLLKL